MLYWFRMVSFVMILVSVVGTTKVIHGVNDIDVGLGNIMECTGTNNQVSPSHGALNRYFIIPVDVEKLL